MKKLLLMSTLCLGLLVAAGCSEDNSAVIQLPGATGGTQDVVINETEDPVTVQQVLDYAALAKYDDVTSYKISFNVKLDEKLNNKPISLDASLTALVDANLGFDLSAKATLNDETGLLMGSMMQAAPTEMNSKISATVEGHAQYVLPKSTDSVVDNNVYFDYSLKASMAFGPDSTGTEQSSKVKVDFNTIVEEIKRGLEESGMLPSMPGVGGSSMPDFETVDDFKKVFVNSKISISEVKKDCISVKFEISMKDCLILMGAPKSDVNALTKDAFVSLVAKIDPATGRTKGFSMSCENKDQFFDVFNEISASSSAAQMNEEMKSMLTLFTGLSLDLSIEYGAGSFTVLSEAQKKQYNSVQ